MTTTKVDSVIKKKKAVAAANAAKPRLDLTPEKPSARPDWMRDRSLLPKRPPGR